MFVYKKSIAAAVAAGFATWRMRTGGYSEAETQALVAIWLGVVAVYAARNTP